MGTSTMGSDLHSDKHDKLAKLQARKKELEQLLATKNEELYKLCVQEVKLTGVMPPEAPLSPGPPDKAQPRERLGSVRSAGDKTISDGEDVRDSSESMKAGRTYRQTDKHHETDPAPRKNIAHRLSTPSISGASTRSGLSRHVRRPETSCSNYYPTPPQDRAPDTFSVHTSHVYPIFARREQSPISEGVRGPPSTTVDAHSNVVYRQHTVTTDHVNKLYYNTPHSDMQNVARMRETHFSSSHPDIATNYTHASVSSRGPPPHAAPLLYQYASHLKAQNQHLAGLVHHQQTLQQTKRKNEMGRRNTLQRTQTYHLTSHSDYNGHLENMNNNYSPVMNLVQNHRSPNNNVPPSTEREHYAGPRAHLQQRNPNLHSQLQVATGDEYDYRGSLPVNQMISPLSQFSNYSINHLDNANSLKYSHTSLDSSEKMKEKQWYETSLDSPSGPVLRNDNAPIKAISLRRTPSLGNSQNYEIMTPGGESRKMPQSPNPALRMPSPPQRNDVPLESPKNCTVIEQGKWIPYREVTKPFEMSDFYKYSTKFRNANQKPPVSNINPVPNVPINQGSYIKSPADVAGYNIQEHWQGQGSPR